MKVDTPQTLYVTVENADELKALCDKTEETINILRNLIRQINEFELVISIQ